MPSAVAATLIDGSRVTDRSAGPTPRALRHDRLVSAPVATLGEVLGGGARLTRGEITEVGVGVAWALAALHGSGLRYGRMQLDDVVLRPDGTAGLRARFAGYDAISSDQEASDEVAALIALLLALYGTPPTPPTGPLPAAGTLAANLYAACEPEPLSRVGEKRPEL